MKKLMCLLVVIFIMVGFTACNKQNVEGTWICEGTENGYMFEALGTTDDGEKMGRVKVLPEEGGFLLASISYYYSFTDDNKIEIICYSPSFSGGGVSVEDSQYDVLRVEKEDGVRVLVSEISGERYYYQGNN